MSIVTASLYNKLPSISPSSIANATASTASSAGSMIKDAFSRNIGNAASTAGAHPYLSVAAIISLALTGLLLNARRQTTQTVKQLAKGSRTFGRQKAVRSNPTRANAAKHKVEEIEHRREARLKTSEALQEIARDHLRSQLGEDTAKRFEYKPVLRFITANGRELVPPRYISISHDSLSDDQNWARLYDTLSNDPKSIDHIMVVHYQKSNKHNILIRQHGYDRYKPETKTRLFSFDFAADKLPTYISLDKIYQGDHSQLGKLVGATVPKDIRISYLQNQNL